MFQFLYHHTAHVIWIDALLLLEFVQIHTISWYLNLHLFDDMCVSLPNICNSAEESCKRGVGYVLIIANLTLWQKNEALAASLI